MSRIVVFGAAGRAGVRVVAEAAARGHRVTAVARDPGRLTALPAGVRAVGGDVLDPVVVTALAKEADALVLTVGGPDPGLYAEAVGVVADAVRALGPGGPRIVHMGGGASLLDEQGVRIFDAPGFPPAFRDSAAGQIAALDAYRACEGVTWTYVSPPPVHFAPGERRGTYRTALDHPVAGEDGRARLSYEDFAVALVDEIETPRHLNRRFTVGY